MDDSRLNPEIPKFRKCTYNKYIAENKKKHLTIFLLFRYILSQCGICGIVALWQLFSETCIFLGVYVLLLRLADQLNHIVVSRTINCIPLKPQFATSTELWGLDQDLAGPWLFHDLNPWRCQTHSIFLTFMYFVRYYVNSILAIAYFSLGFINVYVTVTKALCQMPIFHVDMRYHTK